MTIRRALRLCFVLAFCSLLVTGGAVGATLGVQDGEITVRDVTLDGTTVETGETVTVEGIVENEGAETQPVDVTLTVDGEVVETRTAEAVQPGFPVVATFEWTPSEPGTYQLAINGVEAESELVVEDSSGDEESDGDQGTDSDGGTSEDGDSGPGPSQFEVRNVTLDEAEIAPGGTTTVVADIGNNGDERGDYEVTLEVDGEPVRTETVTEVQPLLEVGAQQRFDYTPTEAGTYTISVNGIEANQQLVVEESGGGGGLFGFLGFLPLGLIRTVVLFVGLPILLIYLALKGLAIYLGY